MKVGDTKSKACPENFVQLLHRIRWGSCGSGDEQQAGVDNTDLEGQVK